MDNTLRLQLLRALVKDRQFLRRASADVDPETFPDRMESLVAGLALQFWDKYTDPLGPMLQSWASEAAAKKNLSEDSRKKLRGLISSIHSAREEQVSVQALIDRVKTLKAARFWDDAVDEVLEAKEKDELTPDLMAEIFERAGHELNVMEVHGHDVFGDLEKRIERRSQRDERKYPALMIDGLDDKLRKVVGRGHLGMFLAPPASGKGQALIHVAISYALQGWNVLLISLEDPEEEVEDRFDACLSQLPKNRLAELPNKLRKRFLRAKKEIHGRIRVIDGTDGGWSVAQVEKTWHILKREENFTADVIIIDYDDEIVPPKKHIGESARRFEFADIYRALRQMASRLQVIVWTAAQTSVKAEGKRVVLGQHTAEDFSKIRKSTLCISIGQDPKADPNKKHLYVVRHKLDRSKFGIDIMSNFRKAIFYDRQATLEMKDEEVEA